MEKKLGVFLTGGGGKGSFHIGFFKALEEMGIKPDFICGSSVGALVGGAATYLDSYEMLEAWKTLTMESVLNVDSRKFSDLEGSIKTLKLWKETFISCCKPKILIDIEQIRKLLYASVDGKSIMDSKVDFGCTTTVLPSFEHVKKFKQDMTKENVLEWILASLYLPIFRPQKIIDGRNYIDIADKREYPLDMMKQKEVTDLVFVDISNANENKIRRSLKLANIGDETKVTIIDKPYKASLLDFTEEQTKINYQKGYETSIKKLEKVL